MPILLVLAFAFGAFVEVLLTTVLVMLTSSILHAQWWDAVPALSFPDAMLIGILTIAINYATGVSIPTYPGGGMLVRIVLSLLVIPFLLTWVIGKLNDSIITSFPDMGYGTAFLLTVVGIFVALIGASISNFFSGYVMSKIPTTR